MDLLFYSRVPDRSRVVARLSRKVSAAHFIQYLGCLCQCRISSRVPFAGRKPYTLAIDRVPNSVEFVAKIFYCLTRRGTKQGSDLRSFRVVEPPRLKDTLAALIRVRDCGSLVSVILEVGCQ